MLALKLVVVAMNRWLNAQVLYDKNRDRGVVWWEFILLVLVVAGLVAVFLPVMTSPHPKSRNLEARNYTGALNRAQQAYFLENSSFTSSVADLGLGIPTQTKHFTYSIRRSGAVIFHYATPRWLTAREQRGIAPFSWDEQTQNSLKGYVGAVTMTRDAKTKDWLTAAILCEAVQPGTSRPDDPVVQNGTFRCGHGTVEIGQ
jgi:type II secretory pathway pseudopilin PulG